MRVLVAACQPCRAANPASSGVVASETAPRRTQAGGGAVVLLTGPAGIGKTAVAEQLGRIALQQKMAVLWGSCVAGHGQPPYWPFRQILRQLVAVRGWAKLAGIAGADAGLLN